MTHTILVPLDGSARAEAILPKVVTLATALDAEVVLLRVAKAWVFPGVDPSEAQVRVVRDAEEYLAVKAEQLRLWGVPARTAVRYGEPLCEILDHIRFAGVTLVAMASRGHGAMRRLILGSVAAAVLQHAGVPVLLLGPEGHVSAGVRRAA
jgi:nucleotide-binding universal stress UspA family protein